MSLKATKQQQKQLEQENQRRPLHLAQVPPEFWPAVPMTKMPIEVWRSRKFLVQVYQEQSGIVRLTVCRTSVAPNGKRWDEGISWDELQLLKMECGRGQFDAVEIFPADADVVNVANMRHLWVLPVRLPFARRKG